MAKVAKHVFLYGHYDSRGGSVAVLAEERAVADKKYNDFCFGGTCMSAVLGDFLGHGVLHVDEDVIAGLQPGQQQELDCGGLGNDDPELVRSFLEEEHEGCVLVAGEDQTWPPQSSEDFLEVQDSYVLEHVAWNKRPEILTAWHWPRWQDDAFSFVLLA